MAVSDRRAQRQLLQDYFVLAQQWPEIPLGVHDLLRSRSQLGLPQYRELLLRHCQAGHGPKFLEVLFEVPDNNDLLDGFLRAQPTTTYPAAIIEVLLARGETRRATDVFAATNGSVPDGPTDAFLWRVCPVGMELATHKLQPQSWQRRFETALKAADVRGLNTSLIATLLQSKNHAESVKHTVRRLLAQKGRSELHSESTRQRQEFLKERKKPTRVTWYESAPFLGVLFAAGVIYFGMGESVLVAAVGALLAFVIAGTVRRSGNIKSFAERRLAEWFENRRNSLAGVLAMSPAEAKSALGAVGNPNPLVALARDVVLAGLLIGVSGFVYLFYRSEVHRLLEVGDQFQWNRSWKGTVSTGKTVSVRLREEDGGLLSVSVYRYTIGNPGESDRTAFFRFSDCEVRSSYVTCTGSGSIALAPEPKLIRARLSLNLAAATGELHASGTSGSEMIRLEGTPLSMLGAPRAVASKAFVAKKASDQGRPIPQGVAARRETATPTEERRETWPNVTQQGPATSSAAVPAAGSIILSSGFVGLKVGQSVQDAKRFFGAELVPDTEATLQCGWSSVKGQETTRVFIHDGQVRRFLVRSPQYQTRSGVRVGDSIGKVVNLFSNDPTYRVDKQSRMYSVGVGQPVSITFYAEGSAAVTLIEFGDSDIAPEFAC